MPRTSRAQTQRAERMIAAMSRSVGDKPLPSVSLIARKKRDPFRVLVSTVISLRTKDEVTMEASRRLFAVADTPKKLIDLGVRAIEKAIYALIVEGAAAGIWAFQDAERGNRLVSSYLAEKGDRAESPEPNPDAAATPANHSSLRGEDPADVAAHPAGTRSKTTRIDRRAESSARLAPAIETAARFSMKSTEYEILQSVTAFTEFPAAAGATRTVWTVGHPRSLRGNCGHSHRPFARSGGTSVLIRGNSCRTFLSRSIIGQERHETQKASSG